MFIPSTPSRDALRGLLFLNSCKVFANAGSERRLAINQWPIPIREAQCTFSKTRSSNRQLAGDPEKRVEMQISIIVPVFNEAPLIRPFLQHLRERAPEAEVIVADGGSSDGTNRLAAEFCDQLVKSERGRTVQMNAGARAARGEILWFVHVDAEVPRGCLDEIGRMMSDSNVVGGYFRIRLPRSLIYRLTDSFGHYAGILLRMRCGDHGIFCRRTTFLDIGGFPEAPLTPAPPKRSRKAQRAKDSRKPSSLRVNWACSPDAGLRSYRNSLPFRRSIVRARTDLQTHVLQRMRSHCPERVINQ